MRAAIVATKMIFENMMRRSIPPYSIILIVFVTLALFGGLIAVASNDSLQSFFVVRHFFSVPRKARRDSRGNTSREGVFFVSS